MALKLTALFGFLAAFELGFIDAFQSDFKYIKSSGAFYRYHSEEATWIDANYTCSSEGGWLFHPDSAEELSLVLKELHIVETFVFLGFSDLKNENVYETVDGRPISQVYNKWQRGFPHHGIGAVWRCGEIDIYGKEISLNDCDIPHAYICKASIDRETTVTATMKRQLENLTAAMEVLSSNYTTAMEVSEQEVASMKLQAANQAAYQAAAIERLTAVEREVETLKLHASSQCSLLERMAVAIENQAAASGKLIEVFERQAVALEKISNSLDSIIDVRSEQ